MAIFSGDIFAENYTVSSSVTNVQISSVSGSTKSGDSSDDTHQFTGSLSVSGSTSDVVTVTGGAVGGGSNSEILKIKAPSTGHFASFGVSDDGSERVQIKAGTSSGLRNLELTNILQLKFMSNEFGILGGNRANSYLQAGTSRGIIFNTNDSNRALFLDASQNAVFSGNVSGSSTSTGSFGRLETAGTAKITSNLTTNKLILSNQGSQSSPAITFSVDDNTGIYQNTDNELDLSINNNTIVNMDYYNFNIQSATNLNVGISDDVKFHVSYTGKHISGSSISTGSFGVLKLDKYNGGIGASTNTLYGVNSVVR